MEKLLCCRRRLKLLQNFCIKYKVGAFSWNKHVAVRAGVTLKTIIEELKDC